MAIGQEGAFCNSCWQKLQFITEPKCKICSYPFEFEIEENMLCAGCLRKKPAYDKAFCAFIYNDIMRQVIAKFKYRDNAYLSKKLAQILYHRFGKELQEIDIIAAVPLHTKRLRKRKFNQSLMLAKTLATLSNITLNPHLIIRKKNTIAQAGLSKKERENNLRNAFEINKDYQKLINHKTILLIDDVMTTGATLENCTKTLKKNGASQVYVLTIAKTTFD